MLENRTSFGSAMSEVIKQDSEPFVRALLRQRLILCLAGLGLGALGVGPDIGFQSQPQPESACVLVSNGSGEGAISSSSSRPLILIYQETPPTWATLVIDRKPQKFTALPGVPAISCPQDLVAYQTQQLKADIEATNHHITVQVEDAEVGLASPSR